MSWAREVKILNCQEQEKLHIAEGSCSKTWTLVPGRQQPAHSQEGPRDYVRAGCLATCIPNPQVVPHLRGAIQRQSAVCVGADIRVRLMTSENMGKIYTGCSYL